MARLVPGLPEQSKKHLFYELKCGTCGLPADYIPDKLPEDIAKTARCKDCRNAELKAESRDRAARTRAFKKAQTAFDLEQKT